MEKWKRSVIREELVMVTEDYKLAIVLNQLIYWTQHVKDFDAYMAEEKKREGQLDLERRHGWIYKSAEELTEETMMLVSKKTMRDYLKQLIDLGFLAERGNPTIRWDHTKQYRVNLVELQQALREGGYVLQGYKRDFSLKGGGAKEEAGIQEDEGQAVMGLQGERVEGGRKRRKGKRKRKREELIAPVGEVVAYLNEKALKKFNPKTGVTRRLIQARFHEGFSLEDFKKVIDNKCFDWIADSKMSKFLRPETLFGSKFEAYLNEESSLAGELAFDKYLKELEKDE
ncbi:MAG: conserved phage C-terminal domain-containing protein [Bacillus sp. (in: Bacteria)]|nr:conserved phage C-terminal domain-containing protein [Bacillus sp. (in: firmicutes)]